MRVICRGDPDSVRNSCGPSQLRGVTLTAITTRFATAAASVAVAPTRSRLSSAPPRRAKTSPCRNCPAITPATCFKAAWPCFSLMDLNRSRSNRSRLKLLLPGAASQILFRGLINFLRLAIPISSSSFAKRSTSVRRRSTAVIKNPKFQISEANRKTRGSIELRSGFTGDDRNGAAGDDAMGEHSCNHRGASDAGTQISTTEAHRITPAALPVSQYHAARRSLY